MQFDVVNISITHLWKRIWTNSCLIAIVKSTRIKSACCIINAKFRLFCHHDALSTCLGGLSEVVVMSDYVCRHAQTQHVD